MSVRRARLLLSSLTTGAMFLAGATCGAGSTPPKRPDDASTRPATLGQPAIFSEVPPAAQLVHVTAGTRLWSRPDARASSVIRVDAEIDLPVLGRVPGWIKVRYAGRTGWLPAADTTSPEPGKARDLRANPARLARARQLIGEDEPVRQCGFLPLYTDVQDPALLHHLSAVVSALPAAYRARYDLQPTGEPVEAVVVFRRSEDFAAFSHSETELGHLQVAGFARDGLAVVYVGEQNVDQVTHDLVHEVTHLLNRRVFGLALPPWLEEGMANDLGYCRIASGGELMLGTLGGRREEADVGRYEPGGWLSIDKRVHESGAIASLARLRQRAVKHSLHPVGNLCDLTWQEFAAENGRQERYDESTFLVRYLLDGGNAGVRRVFLDALQRLANATTNEPARIDPAAWIQGGDLDSHYRAWLLAQKPAPDEPDLKH